MALSRLKSDADCIPGLTSLIDAVSRESKILLGCARARKQADKPKPKSGAKRPRSGGA